MTEEGRALIPAGIVSLPVPVEVAVQGWREYLKLCEALLDPSDYQVIRGKKFRKKSGWRKLARAFNITDRIEEKSIARDGRGFVVSADFLVEAIAPNGRVANGWGSCSIAERGHEADELDRNGKVSCPGPCDGRVHFSNADHDVPATAHTRAKNRAIADLIGAGEVSAEEIEADRMDEEEGPRHRGAPAKPPAPRAPQPSAEPTPAGATMEALFWDAAERFGRDPEKVKVALEQYRGPDGRIDWERALAELTKKYGQKPPPPLGLEPEGLEPAPVVDSRD